ncbi:MAG: polysaccharide biosynthesis protein [Xenococcaceae cyanobacterium]
MNKHVVDWLHAFYKSLSRTHKRRILVATDAVLFVLAISSAFFLRFDFKFEYQSISIQDYYWLILLLIFLKLLIFHIKGIYRPILRYTGLEFLSTATQAILYSSGALVLLAYLLREDKLLPRSILIIDALLTLVLVVGMRLLIRSLFRQLNSSISESKSLERFIIYGAGVAGSQLARTLIHEPGYRLIAFVDDNPDLQRQVIQGFRVYSPADLPKLLTQKPFDTVILAMPALNKVRKRQIIDRLQFFPVLVKTIPTLGELLSGKVSIRQIRNVDVAELLGREEVMPHPELLQMDVTGKSVLVTGAGGSIGSELCRQIAELEPKCLVLYELSEFSLYNIDIELAETHPSLKRVAYLGNVTDQIYFETILKRHQVDTIYHAAAYKHVPLVEANPTQGIYNNVCGTLIAARCAIACGVSNFVLISTDKAVRPTNIMGASKRVAELVVQGLAEQPETTTCFAIVRFGNVLDSSGSVVPRFRKQIAQGKPITITHREVTRYFMSIPEAVRLVIQAGAMATGGEVFLLDMGEPIRIYDLALQMIRLSGLEPERDIEIEFTGLRPGEKLYEELLIDSANIRRTRHPKIFSANERKMSWEILHPSLEALLLKARFNDHNGVVRQLKALVPEYQPQKYLIAANGIRN